MCEFVPDSEQARHCIKPVQEEPQGFRTVASSTSMLCIAGLSLPQPCLQAVGAEVEVLGLLRFGLF